VAEKARYPRHGLTPKDCDRYSLKLLQGRLKALKEARVDHLVVTGDVTLSAEASEFKKAQELLAPWAEARKLTVVPGNHDVWTEESITTQRFLRAMGPDGRGAPAKREDAAYPHVVQLAPDLVLIALDSSRCGEDPHETPGELGQGQLMRTRDLAKMHGTSGRGVVLAFHHHVVLPRERLPSDAATDKMPLSDADQVVRLVAELPVVAILHGHRHAAFRLDLPGVSGPTPLLCAGSASRDTDQLVKRARAFVYEMDRNGVASVEALVAT
jgi:3',5'-cyclic AMP phosphodiesterase CpdA